MMQTTDDIGMPVPMIFHGLSCDFRAGSLDSEPYHSSGKCVHLCGTSQSATSSTSVCHVSELLEQPVNATFRPFFVRKFFPQLSHIISLQMMYFLLESYLCR